MKLLGVKMAEETKKEEERSYMPPEKPPVEKVFCSDGAGLGEAPPEETKSAGRWVTTDIGPVWFNPETNTHCLSAEAAKCCQLANAVLLADEDDIGRKDYEAARAFAWHAHGLLSMCEKYEAMLAVCGSRLLEPEARALEALDKLRENLDDLADLKIKKLPHQDVVFMPQSKPYGDV